MIEKTIQDYLIARLDVPVYMEIPPNPAGSFVVLKKAGGGVSEHVNSAMLQAQSCAPSLAEAALLNEAVKAAMMDADALDEICSAELNSDYNYTDTASKRYRYQAVFDVVHY